MVLRILAALLVLWGSMLHAEIQPYFNYDLHITTLPGTSKRVMVCFHGYGANYQIVSALRQLKCIEATLVGFNFPDYDLQEREYDCSKAAFGTIDELLPALYVLKQVVVDQGLDSVDLYGFSAGGGALINVIGVLNSTTYDAKLLEIGIGSVEKTKLLNAIQNGIVILDTPLKSIEEIIALRGSTEEFKCLSKNYRDNNFRPIDSITLLKGLSLTILLHFQVNDEILSNRDDDLFIERIKAVQPKTIVIIGNDGGHLSCHSSLWKMYSAINS